MPEATEQPTPPLRTWRPMAAWTAGIVVALGVAWFVAAVVVPFMKTRAVVADYAKSTAEKLPTRVEAETRRALAVLGGNHRALVALRSYMSWPRWAAHDKGEAALLMRGCEESGIDALLDLAATSSDANVREAVCMALCWTRPPAKKAVPVLAHLLADCDANVRTQAGRALESIGPSDREIPQLKMALRDGDERVRRHAVRALGTLGSAAAEAVSDVEALLQDGKAEVRAAAAEALKKIRGEEKPK